MDWFFQGPDNNLIPDEQTNVEHFQFTNQFTCEYIESGSGSLCFDEHFSFDTAGKDYPLGGTENSNNTDRYSESCSIAQSSTEALSSNQRATKDQENDQMERTDDIFLTPFLGDEQLDVENPYQSMSFEHFVPEMLIDSAKGGSGIANAWYLKTWQFPLPMTNDIGDDKTLEDNPDSCLASDVSERSKEQIMKDSLFSTSHSDDPSANLNCVNYLEENVLLQLEDVRNKLSFQTRICLRDALYRLADCSKQYLSVEKFDLLSPIINIISGAAEDDGSLSFGEQKPAESNTNALDRTVANLMFNYQNYGTKI